MNANLAFMKELQDLQNENIALYEKLAILKKERLKMNKRPEIEDENQGKTDFKAQIEQIQSEQNSAEAHRICIRKELHSKFNQLKEMQDQLDNQNSEIQTQLIPTMKSEEEKISNLIQSIKFSCNSNTCLSEEQKTLIDNLLSQLSLKLVDSYESQKEIEKLSRLIILTNFEKSTSYSEQSSKIFVNHNSEPIGLNSRKRVIFQIDGQSTS